MKYTNTDAATPSSFAPPTPSPADPRHWTPPLSFSGVGSPSRDAIGPEPRHLARDRRVVRGEMLREDAAGCRETLYPPPPPPKKKPSFILRPCVCDLGTEASGKRMGEERAVTLVLMNKPYLWQRMGRLV